MNNHLTYYAMRVIQMMLLLLLYLIALGFASTKVKKVLNK